MEAERELSGSDVLLEISWAGYYHRVRDNWGEGGLVRRREGGGREGGRREGGRREEGGEGEGGMVRRREGGGREGGREGEGRKEGRGEGGRRGGREGGEWEQRIMSHTTYGIETCKAQNFHKWLSSS